jgi:hypothetical protein
VRLTFSGPRQPRRYTAAFAFLVAAAGTAAVIVYRYVNVGKIGPIPNMYDPFWAPFEKNLSLVGEIVATLTAAALFVILHRRARDEIAHRAPTRAASALT